MAFKQKGFNPGVGTGMGGAFSSSPNRIKGRPPKDIPRPYIGGKQGVNKMKSSVNKAKEKYSPNNKDSKFSMSREEAIAAHKAKMKETIEKMKADGAKPEEIAKYVNQERTKLKEGGSDYLKHSVGVEGPGTYVKEGGEVKTSMKKLPIGSEERKAEYDRRGWKYDDTIAGYNKDGSKKEEVKSNEPESDPTPDPTVETQPKTDDITEPEYSVTSQKGRKTTTAVRDGGKVMTDTLTERNIGDKRVTTMTDTDKNRSIRHKQKFDKKGKKTKDKKKMTMPDGTVVKIKNTKRGKKVKVRKKGQLFAKKVDPSQFENM
tara:strand:- start:818 stop:1768 length:951 start_codon:yes stop_codon:yes gene_type:complete